MAKFEERNKARKLRRKGRSINEIAERVNASKSSVSKWCRNISLAPKQIERLAQRQKNGSYKGRMKYLEKIRKKRMKEVARLKRQGIKDISELSKRDFFLSGVAIYWGEGATSPSREEVSFYNSDPKMVIFMLKWFREICKVSTSQFSIQIRINEIHRDRVKKVEKYWSQLMGISLAQFTKTILIKSKSKKIYSNLDNHYGTVRIMILRGTQLRRKINGWIEGLKRGII